MLVKPERYPVSQVGYHISPHGEEWCAAAFLVDAGEKFFPGVANAILSRNPRIFSDPTAVNGREELIQRRVLCLGVGKDIFDEHGKDDEKTSCISLVRNWLGINDPAAIKLEAAVTHADLTDKVHPFEISNWTKKYNRSKLPVEQVSRRVVPWYSYMLRYLRGDTRPDHVVFSPEILAKKFEAKYHASMHGNSVMKIYTYFMSFSDRTDAKLLEMGNVFKAIASTYPRQHENDFYRIALSSLKEIFEAAVKFDDLFEDFDPRMTPIYLPGSDKPYLLKWTESDDADTAIISRRKGSDINVNRRPSTGQIQVTTKKIMVAGGENYPQFDLSVLLGEWRKREWIARNRTELPNLSESEWRKDGTLDIVSNIYGFAKGCAILNGSVDSAQGVTPTLLSQQEVVELCKIHTLPVEIPEPEEDEDEEDQDDETQEDEDEGEETEEEGSDDTQATSS
jgi:hypothetical protein